MDCSPAYCYLDGKGAAQGFTTTGCRVPLDVVHLIMEQLASIGALRALGKCSLVCNDFATICQKRIFTDIVLSNKGGFEGINRTFPALASFKQALDSKAYLEAYVRSLDYFHDFDRHSQWPPVLRRLRHIQTFRVCFSAKKRISWSEIASSFRSSLVRFIRTNQITHLDLVSLCSDLPTHIFALIPRLEFLTLSHVTLHNNPPFFLENPPRLRFLHVGSHGDQAVDTLIASQSGIIDLSSLKNLAIDTGGSPQLMGIIRDLLQQSEALESVKFGGSLPSLDFNDNLARCISQKCLQSLRSIELNIDLWKVEDDPYLNLTHELEKISGRNILENLIFLILVPMQSTCNTETLRWSELDRVLSPPSAFPFLRGVKVAVDVSYYSEPQRNKDMERKLAVICNEGFPWLKANEQVKSDISLEISELD